MTLTYPLELKINLSLDKVTRMYTNRDLYPKWQPGLISMEAAGTDPYPKYKLRFAFGRRRMDMDETVFVNALPGQYHVEYKMKGVVNRMEHSFSATADGQTLWHCKAEFKFSGLKKLVAMFIKDGFRQQTLVIMNNFKRYAEAHRE
jgi:hypothetical protein